MAFPDIHVFPAGHPGPYELQMGRSIASLLRLFAGRVPDGESNARVSELASEPARWSAGHAVYDEVRRRLLVAMEAQDRPRALQHHFEESCCQALYNAVEPPDPFDPGSAFFVAAQAIGLARAVAVPVEEVIGILAPVAPSSEQPRQPYGDGENA
jgi:hypothetical protein